MNVFIIFARGLCYYLLSFAGLMVAYSVSSYYVLTQ